MKRSRIIAATEPTNSPDMVSELLIPSLILLGLPIIFTVLKQLILFPH